MSLLLRHTSSIPLLLAVAACGCAGDKERLVLEGRLRENEATIRDLQQKVEASEQLLADQDQELIAFRNSNGRKADRSGGISNVSLTSETATAWGSVKSIQIHRMTSGMIDDSGQTLVNVVVQPLDEDDELVKVSGHLKVTAAAVSDSGDPEVIAAQEIDITESRKRWTRGLVSSGFHIQMTPDKSIDAGNDLLLTAVLDLGGGRTFRTSELIPVTATP